MFSFYEKKIDSFKINLKILKNNIKSTKHHLII
jgi:hypothetical protein